MNARLGCVAFGMVALSLVNFGLSGCGHRADIPEKATTYAPSAIEPAPNRDVTGRPVTEVRPGQPNFTSSPQTPQGAGGRTFMGNPSRINRQNFNPAQVTYSYSPGGMNDTTTEEASHGTWSRDDRTIKILGVCKITESDVACWSVNGQTNADLAARMRAGLQGQNGFGQDPSFKFGMKNRYFVIERSSMQNGVIFTSASTQNFQNIQMMSFGYQMNGQNDGLSFGRLSVDKSMSHYDLSARVLGLPGPKPVTMNFSEGAKANYDGKELTLGGWKRGSSGRRLMNVQGGRGVLRTDPPDLPDDGWLIFFGVQPAGGGFTIRALDNSGKPIDHVDGKGKPISDLEFVKTSNQNGFNPGYNLPGQPASASFQYPMNASFTPNAFTYWTNIDPKYIASLELSVHKSVNVLFKNLPLDPH